jgi:Tfp pilus assembly protein PilV
MLMSLQRISESSSSLLNTTKQRDYCVKQEHQDLWTATVDIIKVNGVLIFSENCREWKQRSTEMLRYVTTLQQAAVAKFEGVCNDTRECTH